MAWHADLLIAYDRADHVGRTDDAGRRTRALARHNGPYRVLKALYPEGELVCHHTLLHPPSGLVGGDTLKLTLDVGHGAHALLTTPGASRFYRSTGPLAEQTVVARVAAQGRLEWLPQENIVSSGALALNTQVFELAAGAQMMGWDFVALGLPHSGAPFVNGSYMQHLEIPGIWLERGQLQANDTRLLDSPLGLGGHRAMATLWWACGDVLSDSVAAALLETSREVLSQEGLRQGLGQGAGQRAGITRVNPHVVVLRAIGPHIEGLKRQLNAVRRVWRETLWGLQGQDPRVWST